MRLLTLEGRIKILKPLAVAVSEVIHLLLIPNSIIIQLIFCVKQKSFIWYGKKAKIKQSIHNGYEKRGIKILK